MCRSPPPAPFGGSNPRTPVSRAMARLADETRPIGASFFVQGVSMAALTSAASRYGGGWATVRKAKDGDAEGLRVWKKFQPPGKGQKLDAEGKVIDADPPK